MTRYFLILLFCLFSGSAQVFANTLPTLQLGVLSWRDEPGQISHWQPTLDAIQEYLPDTEVVLYSLSLQQLEAALAAGELDFVMTNPGHYVQLSQHYTLAPLATLRNPAFDPPQQALGSVLVTRAGAGYPQHWQDLKTARVAAVHPEAFGGFQLIWDQLEQRGLHLHGDVGEWVFTGYPMEALLERLNAGEVDALVLRSCLLESLAAEGRLRLSDYQVIGARSVAGYPCQLSTDLYPDWPFLSTGRRTADQVQQVILALLENSPANGAGAQWSAPLSYQSVYQLFERLRVGPYASFPRHPLLAVLHQYRYALLLALALLMLFILHHLRVSFLVRQRSKALQQLMQEQQQKQSELAHLSRFSLMGELAAGLAHELNQPLTASMNYAQGLQRLLNKPAADHSVADPDKLREAVTRIIAQNERAAGIIRQLRSFLRKELPSKENLDLRELLPEALKLIETAIQKQQVRVDLQLPAMPVQVFGHRVELLQLFINLLNNALDAMQATPVAERCITLRVVRQQNTWVIEMADAGEGITASVASRVFDPFFTTRSQGMGLGLKLCKTLVRSHGGTLTLNNRAQGGALARIELPVITH